MTDMSHRFRLFASLTATAVISCGVCRADEFSYVVGGTTYSFQIDFVTVGNPGNPDDRDTDNMIDTPADLADDEFSSPYGGVPYIYRIGKYAITQAQYYGAASGDQRPANHVDWFEAAWYVNWLNTITGHQPAYDLSRTPVFGQPDRFNWTMRLWPTDDSWQLGGENRFRHKDAKYFLPSEDEWYKSVYHANINPAIKQI